MKGSPVYSAPGVVEVTWAPEPNLILVEWLGWANRTEWADALNAGHRVVVERGCLGWLADCRGMKAVQESDQAWIDEDWFPRVIRAGLRRMAVILPTSALAQMNVEAMLSRVPGSHLEVAYFPTPEEGRAWLETVADVAS